MELKAKAKQSGVSFITVLFIVGVLACAAIVGAQVLPTAVEYQAILKASQKASEGATVAEVRKIFERASDIDNITSITPKDLEVTKDGDRIIVKFAYNKEIHLVGPAFLLLKYAGQGASK